MVGGKSRKRNAPAHLREENWYLVSYEADDQLRVLGEDEIEHIFPDGDGEEDIQIGDIVSAMWLPNGKFYDAKVLQNGNDRNELMKARMRLEKAAKKYGEGGTDKAQEPNVQPKRKPDRGVSDGQKKKKKTQKQTECDNEKDNKAKEREEKKKKKEEDQLRQKCMLEARKAQAASRWASTPSNLDQELEDSIVSSIFSDFIPEPVSREDTSATMCQSSMPPTPLIQQTITVRRQNCHTDTSDNTPVTKTSGTSEARQPKNTSKPKRGLHFQSVVEDSDSSDYENILEQDHEITVAANPAGDCCKQLKTENEALRKRLNKVHKRLGIALKAKTTEELVENLRPGAGVLDEKLALEYKMVEVMEGSGVYWYSHQRAYCSAFKCWAGYINAAIDMFFTKETLAASCAKGIEKKSKNGSAHQPLTPLIIQTLVGKVCSKYSKDNPTPSHVIQKINMKCVEARRPQRIRVVKTVA